MLRHNHRLASQSGSSPSFALSTKSSLNDHDLCRAPLKSKTEAIRLPL